MSGIEIKGQVGESALADGAVHVLRQDRLGALLTSDHFPKYYELNRNGRLFSDGMGLTAINNATYTSGTLSATCTPIAGVWNPLTSDVNLVVLRVALGVATTATTSTGPGGFVWASSTGNAAISTGSTPLSRKTGAATGSSAKGFANVALTGLTNNLVVRGSAGMGGGSAMALSHVGTAVGVPPINVPGAFDLDGDFIVPPGGVLALLATTTPAAHSAASMLLWAEVPV
jgi:hypothetical protein